MPPDMLSSAPLHGPSPDLRVGDFFRAVREEASTEDTGACALRLRPGRFPGVLQCGH